MQPTDAWPHCPRLDVLDPPRTGLALEKPRAFYISSLRIVKLLAQEFAKTRLSELIFGVHDFRWTRQVGPQRLA